MISRLWKHVLLTTGLALLAFPQGLDTTATKEDWEEINFEQGSSILSDGYPSLLRLAELLKSQGYRTATVSDWGGADLGKFSFGFDLTDVPEDQWNLKYLLRQVPKDLRLF